MTKTKQVVSEMMDANKDLFTKFRTVHDAYEKNPEKWQNEFNEVGMKISDVMRKYERILCAHSEAGKYGKFSANLSDKFKDEVRKTFSRIDFIGTLYS